MERAVKETNFVLMSQNLKTRIEQKDKEEADDSRKLKSELFLRNLDIFTSKDFE